MKYGIYYAYWEREWGGNFTPFISRVKRLGFDILEIACGNFHLENDSFFHELKRVSELEGILLTGGYGPRPEHNLASTDSAAVEAAFRFYADVFRKMDLAGVRSLGGALYSYWPVDFKSGFDKDADLTRSISGMKRLADMAADCGIDLNMEVLNRFEGYMLNDCDECLRYVNAVGKPNVHVMLDTFHMNIEEDSLIDAIRLAGSRLGHFHVGEANRKPPGADGRIPWKDIGNALKEIQYDGYVVMEPFVRMGGQVGNDISIWRDLSRGADDAALDEAVAKSVQFLRGLWS